MQDSRKGIKAAVPGHSTISRRAIARGLFAAAAFLFLGRSATASDLPAPSGPVILTVSGNIGHTTDGSKAVFDLAMLQSLGTVTIDTATPWTDGVQHFEGVLLRDVLKRVSAAGQTLVATAINNYMTEIPASDAQKYDAILAFRQNGQILTLRSKGPLFVIYPFDRDSDLRREEIYDRSIWQLTSIEVR
jgi:hypothetical protein